MDIDEKRVKGEVMDLSHGQPYLPPVIIRAGDYSDCEDAQMIVVTAGAKQSPGQSRLDLVRENAGIVRDIWDGIGETGSDAVMIMASNPVDTLTKVAIKHLKWPRGRIIGSGTVLDSARFRYLISNHCGIDVHNIHAYILGEHGDSELAAWSMTHVAGVSIKEYCKMCRGCTGRVKELEGIFERVRDSAYHLIEYKGSTYFGIGMALSRISSAVLRSEHSVLTVSSMLDGEYGLRDVCLSVPCVVGEDGVERRITPELPEGELARLKRSAGVLRESYESISTT